MIRKVVTLLNMSSVTTFLIGETSGECIRLFDTKKHMMFVNCLIVGKVS